MKFRIAALALLATTTYGGAADMAAAPVPYTQAAPAAPGYNWTGFYVGAMGGGGWSRTAGVDFNGAFAGGTVGANWQISNFVLGIEGEGAWSNIGQTAVNGLIGASSDRVEAFGSITGRLGVAFDNFLIYGKGGFAAASNKISITAFGLAASGTKTHTGYTAGGGVEYGFTPNWSAKAEYLFTHYQSESYFAGLLPPGIASGAFDVHTVKVGINYRFGWGGPVVAKY
jgi:outer membrane immunogenic protein